MDIQTAYAQITKDMEPLNKELGFSRMKIEDENILQFKSGKGIYRLNWDPKSSILSFECTYTDAGEETKFDTISRSLFECNVADERDCRSTANEIGDEVRSLFAARKQVKLEKIKMPKAVSRAKAKNGLISYDTDSLANHFGTAYPELKDDIKKNIAKYGEFLPETFFTETGTEFVLNIIRTGDKTQLKKMFKLLNELYEDGTNEVQDIIGVTILGRIGNKSELMAICDEYMSKYMATAVHEVNKMLDHHKRYIKKMENPPAYKPKKKKKRRGMMSSLAQQGAPQQ